MRFILSIPITFQSELISEGAKLIGLAALVYALDVKAPVRTPCCASNRYIHDRVWVEGDWRVYDKRFWPGDTFGVHLTFALSD